MRMNLIGSCKTTTFHEHKMPARTHRALCGQLAGAAFMEALVGTAGTRGVPGQMLVYSASSFAYLWEAMQCLWT